MPSDKSRRNFLKAAGMATAAFPLSSLAANNFLKEENQPSFRGKRKIGQGDFQYKLDASWGDLDPLEQPVMHCHEMVLDSRGRLVCSTVSSKFDLLVYNRKGKVLDSFNHKLVEPHGLSIAGEGKDQTMWVTDSGAGRVINLDLDGRIIRELTVPADQIPKGQAFKPTETTVGAQGDIYVADGYGTNKIFHYDDKGQLKNVFGGPDHFECCHGIVVDDRRGIEELLITSRAAQNFQRWTMDGKPIATRKLPGLQICRPVISGDETLFAVIVTKSWYHYDGMIAVLDKDFNVVSLPGGNAVSGQQDFHDIQSDGHSFMNPHDVCVDKDGDLYVPQWYSGKTYPIRLKRV